MEPARHGRRRVDAAWSAVSERRDALSGIINLYASSGVYDNDADDLHKFDNMVDETHPMCAKCGKVQSRTLRI